MNLLMNYGGLCRTAPATPGLLIIKKNHIFWSNGNVKKRVNKRLDFAKGCSQYWRVTKGLV